MEEKNNTKKQEKRKKERRKKNKKNTREEERERRREKREERTDTPATRRDALEHGGRDSAPLRLEVFGLSVHPLVPSFVMPREGHTNNLKPDLT